MNLTTSSYVDVDLKSDASAVVFRLASDDACCARPGMARSAAARTARTSFRGMTSSPWRQSYRKKCRFVGGGYCLVSEIVPPSTMRQLESNVHVPFSVEVVAVELIG